MAFDIAAGKKAKINVHCAVCVLSSEIMMVAETFIDDISRVGLSKQRKAKPSRCELEHVCCAHGGLNFSQKLETVDYESRFSELISTMRSFCSVC